MGAPVFLHVCVNWQTRDHMIRAMWMFLQHYPGAVLRKQDHRIVVPGVMTHFFVPADFDLDGLQGLELKGFSIEFRAEVTDRQVEFLQSRVRG